MDISAHTVLDVTQSNSTNSCNCYIHFGAIALFASLSPTPGQISLHVRPNGGLAPNVILYDYVVVYCQCYRCKRSQFNSKHGQIKHSISNGSPALRNFLVVLLPMR